MSVLTQVMKAVSGRRAKLSSQQAPSSRPTSPVSFGSCDTAQSDPGHRGPATFYVPSDPFQPPTAISDLYAGPLYLRRPDAASNSFLFAAVGPTIRFLLDFFHDPAWNVQRARIRNRSDCHLELVSNMVERMPTSNWIQIRSCVLDSIGEDVVLAPDAITGAVRRWADRSQNLGFPTFKDFFTIVEFLDRTRGDGCNGRESEWTMLVNIVRSELERLQTQHGYFS
ncbi:hypothetical protein CPB85DRAFT_1437344 [Mucidula mucida]|nr:hypothetical protein CPB85DRAFT_1437344 [Mucidula mucida]